MADYKELIRKAIQALPENNGAARRAVYEKARAALVGQLRGLNPPLAARDITQHRLQLEDCIRQVEQEASEAVIAGLKQNEELASPPQQQALPPPRAATSGSKPVTAATRPAGTARTGAAAPPRTASSGPPARPTIGPANRQASLGKPQALPRVAAVQPKTATAIAAAPVARTAPATRAISRSQTATYPRAVPEPEPEEEIAEEPSTIEDIIAAAEDAEPAYNDSEAADEEMAEAPQPPMFKLEARRAAKPALAAPVPAAAPAAAPPRAESRPLPAIVARAEAAKAGRSTPRPAEPVRRGIDAGRRANALRDETAPPRPEPRQPNVEPLPTPKARNGNAAMSSVREVDLESSPDGDPQVAIERAIATLEREARNDEGEAANGAEADAGNGRGSVPPRRRGAAAEMPSSRDAANSDAAFARAPVETERGGGSAVTIFLVLFLVLLVAAGGGGFWAWHEGFIDFDAMFGKAQQVAGQATAPLKATAPQAQPVPAPQAAAVQTNTEAAQNAPAQSAEQMTAAPVNDAAPVPASVAAAAPAEPSAQSAPKSEERLTQSTDTAAAPASDTANPTAPDSGATATAAGSQSLLLEASQDGTTGAVPFSGTVEWSKGTDEMGQPTLVGKANIPARNLGVSVLIRKNSDPTLPASHLMEINFTVNDSFIGGAISGLPGVLLKNEELVQGTPLVGASARVVGNSFLFALSSSPADETTNKDLLTSRKWIDLAIIYATGKKAIITLEKDDKAEAMFNDVFTAWSKEAAAAPAKPAATPAAGK